MKPRGTQLPSESQAAKPHLLWQRVEDNAFHLRTLSERWIGFSEDDAFARLAKGGSASRAAAVALWRAGGRRRYDQTLLLKKNKKKAGHPFKYLISPCKPQENSKKENEKVLTRFWRFSYKRRFHTQIPSTS